LEDYAQRMPICQCSNTSTILCVLAVWKKLSLLALYIFPEELSWCKSSLAVEVVSSRWNYMVEILNVAKTENPKNRTFFEKSINHTYKKNLRPPENPTSIDYSKNL
jgi:hypothetical protein